MLFNETFFIFLSLCRDGCGEVGLVFFLFSIVFNCVEMHYILINCSAITMIDQCVIQKLMWTLTCNCIYLRIALTW